MMRAVGRSFLLTWRQLWRGGALAALLALVALVHVFLPRFVRGDGTEHGFFETYVRTVSGGAWTLVFVAVLCLSCGLLARERETKTLALSLVRPADVFAQCCGRFFAVLAVVASALVVSAAFALNPVSSAARTAARTAVCRHHYAPALPSVESRARAALADYLADPKTPERVKKAPRRTVLALLAAKETDRYDVVRPGGKIGWPFEVQPTADALAVRVRFATEFDLRAPVTGSFAFGDLSAAVSNATQSVVEFPLAAAAEARDAKPGLLVFKNDGKGPVMVRPRRDLELVAPADSFAANLVRATLQMLALAAALAAFGIFLSASLSRPVALFTAFCFVATVLLAPGVAEQYADELDAPWADRFGLWLSRATAQTAAAFAAPQPISDLAEGRAIETAALLRSMAWNLAIFPACFLALAAFVARRKPL